MNDKVSNVKFHSNRYWQSRYNFRDFMVDKRRFNYPIEKKDMSLSVSKRYNLFRNY